MLPGPGEGDVESCEGPDICPGDGSHSVSPVERSRFDGGRYCEGWSTLTDTGPLTLEDIPQWGSQGSDLITVVKSGADEDTVLKLPRITSDEETMGRLLHKISGEDTAGELPHRTSGDDTEDRLPPNTPGPEPPIRSRGSILGVKRILDLEKLIRLDGALSASSRASQLSCILLTESWG